MMVRKILNIVMIAIITSVITLASPVYMSYNNNAVVEAAHKAYRSLPQPKDLSKQTSGNMAVIMWNLGDEDVTGYSYKVVVNGTQNSIVKSTSVQLTKLKPDKQYTIKVYTMKGNKKSKPGVIKFRTSKELKQPEIKEKQVPSKVRGLKVDNISGNTITVTWAIPRHHIKSLSGYKIVLNGNEYDTMKSDNSSKDLSYTLTNLEYNRTYTISISAINYAGMGSTSTVKAKVKEEGADMVDVPTEEVDEPDNKDIVKDSKTRDSSKRISQVQNLRLGNSESEIVITWDTPLRHSDKIKDYKIYVNGDLVETTTNMKYTYYAPKLNKPYKMEVRAEDDKGVEGMAKSMWCSITKERGPVSAPTYKKVIKVKKLPQTGESRIAGYVSISLLVTGVILIAVSLIIMKRGNSAVRSSSNI